MSILMLLYTLIIQPIEFFIELVFNFSRDKLQLGVLGAIIFVSITVNFFALPLYNIADALQLKERKIQNKLQYWVKHIKKTFKGDEQYMMLSAYYRLNHYSPVYSLRSSLSILIEIPFFIAAYHYLSHCEALHNWSFWVLRDLAAPDGLLVIGGFTINLLPVIMTVVNCVSGWIYAKDAPVKEKVQIYVLAAIFLVLLYNSPSGLVVYWILNNLFSLFKNFVQRYCKRQTLLVAGCFDAAFIYIAVTYMLYQKGDAFVEKVNVYLTALVVLVMPVLIWLYKRWFDKVKQTFAAHQKSYFSLFLFSTLSLVLMGGTLLPSSMIASSPVEFSFLGSTDSPLSYIFSSLMFSTGLFLVWPLAIYLMFSHRVKYALVWLCTCAGIVAAFNAYLFKQNYATVSIKGELDKADVLLQFSPILVVGPILVILAVGAVLVLLERKQKIQYAAMVMCALCLGYAGLSFKNGMDIRTVYQEYRASLKDTQKEEKTVQTSPIFHLSKENKNIFVIFLDRAIGLFVPYILEEFPELRHVYSGFTFYPNTISFSDSTNKGAPALYGGYEYTPENINLRKDEFLWQKHNESLLVMPKIFSSSGWRVHDFGPDYTNYSDFEDFTPFDGLPNTSVYGHVPGLMDKFLSEHPDISSGAQMDDKVRDTLPRFSFLQMIFPTLRFLYYNSGKYFSKSYMLLKMGYVKSYSELFYLSRLTDFSAAQNTYTIMHNNLTHSVMFFEPPYYRLSKFAQAPEERGKIAYPYTSANDYFDLKHYEANAAALLLIGEWIKYLKANDCYDNTRIILVSDHGYKDVIEHLAPDFSSNAEYASYQPLLMFKDFEASGEIKTDRKFMTNADTPELSLMHLGISDINPYTGKKLSGNKQRGYNLYSAQKIPRDWNASLQKNNKQFNLYLEGAYHVEDDIFVESNWTSLEQWFDEHPEEKEKARLAGVKVDGGK